MALWCSQGVVCCSSTPLSPAQVSAPSSPHPSVMAQLPRVHPLLYTPAPPQILQQSLSLLQTLTCSYPHISSIGAGRRDISSKLRRSQLVSCVSTPTVIASASRVTLEVEEARRPRRMVYTPLTPPRTSRLFARSPWLARASLSSSAVAPVPPPLSGRGPLLLKGPPSLRQGTFADWGACPCSTGVCHCGDGA